MQLKLPPATPPHSPKNQAEGQELTQNSKIRAYIYTDQQLKKSKVKPFRAAHADY